MIDCFDPVALPEARFWGGASASNCAIDSHFDTLKPDKMVIKND